MNSSQTEIQEFNAMSRFIMYMSGGLFLTKRDNRFIVGGVISMLMLIGKYSNTFTTNQERVEGRAQVIRDAASSDAAKASVKAEIAVVKQSTSMSTETEERSYYRPTEGEYVKGGRLLLNDPFDDFGQLFAKQKTGPMKYISGQVYK